MLVGAALAGCGAPERGSERGSERIRVVATLPPLAALARDVGGERVVVRSLLGPRADPEASALSLSASRDLAEADLVVALGGGLVPFEAQLLEALEEAGGPSVVTVSVSDEKARDGSRGHGGPGSARTHDHADHDPHLWLDPDRMLATAGRLAAALAKIDPSGAEAYAEGRRRLVARVREVDDRLREQLSEAGGVLLSEHPTWEVLARRYGARVLAVEQEEREPSARRLAEVIAEAREAGVRALVVAAGGRHRLARVVSRELGAPIVELEPLAYDWLASLERAATLAARPSPAAPESPDG